MDLIMGNLKKNREHSSSETYIETPRVPSLFPPPTAALPGSGAAQFHPAAAFFPPNASARASAAFAGTPSTHHRYLGTPASAGDIFLPGNYPRVLESATSYQHFHCPYTMAIAKGSSFEGEGSVAKKPRTVFTPKQLLHLEEEFSNNQFPNMEQRKKIAKTLDLTQQHIQIWFQNRRAKKRRKKKRLSEEERMRRDPKPPPFWPSNLPFSSNLGDIATKSTNKPADPKKKAEQDTVKNGRGSPSPSPPLPIVSRQSPAVVQQQDSQHSAQQHQQQDGKASTKLSPITVKPPKTEHTDGNSYDCSTSTPSNLPCSPQDLPLESPTPVRTPGSSHSQLPTPPPYVPSAPSNHSSLIPVAVMEHTITSEVVLTPPGDLASIHNYPPLLPPESLLAGNFDDLGSFPHGLAPPLYDSLHSTRAARGIIPPPPPPPYSFTSSHSSSSISLSSQLSYTADHHSISFVGPHSFTTHNHSTKLLPTASEIAPGPSSLSPTALSPLTNSDCSSSPLTQDVTLSVPPTLPSEGNFPSLSSSVRLSNVTSDGPPSHGLSSPIHATDPVALTDLQEQWDFFTRAACPVIQTGHEMWATAVPPQPPHPQPSPHIKLTQRKSTSIARTNNTAAATNTGSSASASSQVYSGACGVGYFPPFICDSTVTSISNGAS